MDTLSRTLSIAETAEATGLSMNAIARRIERETLQSVLRDGQRRIPSSELIRAGLIGIDGTPGGEGNGDAPGVDVDRGIPGETSVGLLDRLERQAETIGQMRALQQQGESLTAQQLARTEELEAEVAELRATVTTLEQQPAERRPRRDSLLRRRWLRRR